MKKTIKGLTPKDFGVNEEQFEKIMKWLPSHGITTKDGALDFHTEPSEEAMFNWVNDGDESPWEIRMSAPLPSEDDRCTQIGDTWFFWYEAYCEKPVESSRIFDINDYESKYGGVDTHRFYGTEEALKIADRLEQADVNHYIRTIKGDIEFRNGFRQGYRQALADVRGDAE